MKLALHEVTLQHPAARRGAAAALQQVSLALQAGEQAVVIGPSGAGKTSLLLAAAAALPPQHGQLWLDDQPVWQRPRTARRALRRRLVLAPQVPPLPPRQRVVTSVLAARLPAWGLWTSLRSLWRPVALADAQAALAGVDLADKLFERVDRLSGGERQRVGLARVLLAPASLWLVDEPLSALDPVRAQQALRQLIEQARARGATLLASLHQVDLALAHFPRVIGLRDGRVQFDLPAAAVDADRLAGLYGGSAAPLGEQPGDGPADAGVPAALPPVHLCR